MDEAVIPLRAHHGLCLRFFQGKGYSGAFVENMAQKKAMLEENPLVRLTDQADEICRACPNNLSGQCESAEKVRRYDREVLSRMESILGAYELQIQLEELSRLRAALERSAGQAAGEEERERKLYTSLGPLAGLALCILL